MREEVTEHLNPLLPDALRSLSFPHDDDHHVQSFKVLRPIPHSRNDNHGMLSFSVKHTPSLPPKGSCNSLWSKYQDLQCVEDCDTDHPVFYEQPVWQTLQMFGTSFSSLFPPRTPVSDHVLQLERCYASIPPSSCTPSWLIARLLNSRPLARLVHFP